MKVLSMCKHKFRNVCKNIWYTYTHTYFVYTHMNNGKG